MAHSIHKKQSSIAYRILCGFIAVTFGSSVILPPTPVFAQTVLNLPVPGTIVPPSPGFMPVQMTGLTIHPDNPLRFDFIMDTGHSGLDIHSEEFKQESAKLIKYFMASLTTPEEELWVNLSPYEKDRMIAEGLGKTEMGRDMLAQDYLLKQLTASLMYPEKELGKEFWNKVYKEAHEKFGTTEIPVNTFNKVWIVPDEALVYEQGTSAFVIKSRLAVMLEEDYEAMGHKVTKSQGHQKVVTGDVVTGDVVTTGIIREVILPAIEQEINEGENFASLRQIYNALILATWYKQRLKDSLLGKVYIDQNKTKGIDTRDKGINQKIYGQYIESFKRGVYNFIKEDVDPATQEIIPRKYFSGGVSAARMRNGKWFSQFLLTGGLVLGLTAFSALPLSAQEKGKDVLEGVGNQAGVTAEFVENSPDDLTVTVHNGKNVRPLLLAQAAPLSMKKQGQGSRVKGQEFSIDKDASSPVEQILQEANRKGLDKILFVFDIGGTITGWDKQNVESRGGFQEVSKNLGDLIEHGYYLGASDFPQAAALLNSHGHALAFISTATLEEMLGLMHEKMGIKDLSGVRLIVAKSSKGAYLHHLGARGYYGISPEITTSQDLLSYLRERYPGTTILLNALPKEEIVKLPEVLSVLENQPFVSIGDSEGDYKWAASFPRGNGQAAEGITDTTKDVSIAKPINAGIRTLLEKQAAPSPVKIVMDSPRRLTPNERDAIKADNVPLDELWKVWDRLGTFVTQLSEQITKNNSSTLRNLLTVIQEDYQFVESAVERRLEIDTSSPVVTPWLTSVRAILQGIKLNVAKLETYANLPQAAEMPPALSYLETSLTKIEQYARQDIGLALYETTGMKNWLVKISFDERTVWIKAGEREAARIVIIEIIERFRGLEDLFFDGPYGLPAMDGGLIGKDVAASPAISRGQGSEKEILRDTSDERRTTKEVGGIDLNPALLNLQIKRDGNGVPLPLPMQPIENMHIEGFLPIIINVTPIANLPLLLGLADTKQDADEITPAMKAREPEEVSYLN